MSDRRQHLEELLREVEFSDPMPYTFHIVVQGKEWDEQPPDHPEDGRMYYLQASYPEADSYTGVMSTQWTRKWHIASDATDSQVIQTAFKMCLTSTEHRCREGFKYKDVRVYGPHYDVEDLVKLGKDKGQWQGAPGKDFKW